MLGSWLLGPQLPGVGFWGPGFWGPTSLGSVAGVTVPGVLVAGVLVSGVPVSGVTVAGVLVAGVPTLWGWLLGSHFFVIVVPGCERIFTLGGGSPDTNQRPQGLILNGVATPTKE